MRCAEQQLELIAPGAGTSAARARALERAAGPAVGRTDLMTSAAAAERVRSEGIGSGQARALLRLVVEHPGKTASELGALASDGILGRDRLARRYAIARRMSGLRAAGFLRNLTGKGRESRLWPTAAGLEEVKSWS